MKEVFTIMALFIILNGCNLDDKEHSIPFSETPILIDGEPSDETWSLSQWRAIDQNWLGSDFSEQDFSGNYKILWSHDHIYLLVEIVDDILMDKTSDGLVRYWDDDCLEIFVDEDASGGDHQYNYNAFAYHISLDNKVVDIGVDSLAHYYDHIICSRVTNGNKSVWELSIEVYDDTFEYDQDAKPVTLDALKEIGLAIAYCDNDESEERENFIGSIAVNGEDKNRGWIDAGIFEKFVLLK